jgi:hypothetical protein
MSSFSLGGPGDILPPRKKEFKDPRQQPLKQPVFVDNSHYAQPAPAGTSSGSAVMNPAAALATQAAVISQAAERGAVDVQSSAQVISLADRRIASKDAKVKSAFTAFQREYIPSLTKTGSPVLNESDGGPRGMRVAEPQGKQIPCVTLCDAVYIVTAAKFSRAVTVNWFLRGGKPLGLGAQQQACGAATFNAEQVKSLAPKMQTYIDTVLKPSSQDVAECIAKYCKQYGCPTDKKEMDPAQVCQIVFAIKAAEYGRGFTMQTANGAVTLTPEQVKTGAPKLGETLKALLDRGFTTAAVVAECEQTYCRVYGCKPPVGGGGGGGGSGGGGPGGAGGIVCEEGTTYKFGEGCVPNESIPDVVVAQKKKSYWWIVAAGAAALLAKKYVFVSALAGAPGEPKLIELDEE